MKVWAIGSIGDLDTQVSIFIKIPNNQQFSYTADQSYRQYIEQEIQRIFGNDFVLTKCQNIQEDWDEW